MKKQIILALALLIVGALQAQEKGSYLDFNVGGGLHNFSYSLLNGTEKGQAGYSLNAGYSYFFTPNWGIHTGLGFQTYSSAATLNFLSSIPDIDSDGQAYVFKANYINLQEKQQSILMDIPLTIQYKRQLTDKFGLLASVGAKVALPLQSTFKTTGGEIITTGYYSVWNAELSDMPQHGFSTMTKSFTGNTAIKTGYLGIADLGALYTLSQSLDLYFGGYINYGLNSILTPDTKLIYQPNGIYNGLFASTQTRNVTPISFGVKIGVYLHLGKNKHSNDNETPVGSDNSILPDKKSNSTYSLNLTDSLNFVTFLNSKGVFVKRDKTKLTSKELKEYNTSISSGSSGSKGYSNQGQPISASYPGGTIIPGQPTGISGITGKPNQEQSMGKGIDGRADVTKLTPEELKVYNKSLLSKSSVSEGHSNQGQPVGAPYPGGTIIPIPTIDGSGSIGKFSQGQSKDSTGVANSFNQKEAVGKVDITKLTPEELKVYNKSLLSKSSASKGYTNNGQPTGATYPGGAIIPVLPTGASGMTGKTNQGQSMDSTGVVNSLSQKGEVGKVDVSRLTPEELRAYNKSLLSKSSALKGHSNQGQPISILSPGGTIVPMSIGGSGSTGKFSKGQSNDSTGIGNSFNQKGTAGNVDITKMTPKELKAYNKSLLSKSSASKGHSNQGQPGGISSPGGMIIPVVPIGVAGSFNQKGVDGKADITKLTPEELKEYNKSLASNSSDSKRNTGNGQPIIIPVSQTGVPGKTGKLNQGADSLGIVNLADPNGISGKAPVVKSAPKGIRKFIMSILSKPSNQKGKSGQGMPTDALNPAGNISSLLPTEASNPSGNRNKSSDPFERARQLASSMNQWFEFDSYEITNANDASTKELSDILKANPNFLMVFVGYTCNIGTQVVNIKLGMKRVESVIRKFTEQGVSESQLIGESKGYDEPLVPNTSAENRAKNRRVEITVIKEN